MKTIDSDTLAGIAINMLERTAMVLAEPAFEGDTHPPATRFARIGFHGPGEGTIVLAATDDFLRELAASLLGVESVDVDVEIHGRDALKEMANIVGGSVILALSGEVCEYSLELPQLVTAEDVRILEGRAPAKALCTVVSEGGPLRVYWLDASLANA